MLPKIPLFAVLLLCAACGGGKLDVGSNAGDSGTSASSPDASSQASEAGSDASPCPSSAGQQLVVAESGQFISTFTFDGTDLYYVTTSMADTSQQSLIKRVSAQGGTAVTLAKAPYNSVLDVVAVGDSIYYTQENSSTGGIVYRLAKTGGTPQAVTAPPTDPFGDMVGDGAGDLYFTTDEQGLGSNVPAIVRLAPGGLQTPLGTDLPEVVNIAIDSLSIYSTPIGMTTLSADGGPDVNTMNAVIYATPIAGGSSKTVYGPFMNDSLGAIAVDDENVYACGQSTVFSVPKGGGAPTVLASAQAYPLQVVVQGDEVYWLTEGDVAMGGLGSVSRVTRSGAGVPAALAEGLALPTHFEVGSCAVYWNSEVGPGGSAGTSIFSGNK